MPVYICGVIHWKPYFGLAAALFLGAATACSADLRSRPELSLPITAEKRVIAHYMSNMLYDTDAHSVPTYDSRAHFRPDGPSRAIGGFTQTFPIMDFREDGRTIDEAAEFELRAALALGIDGFQFFYPLTKPDVLKDYNRTIAAFFRAVKRIDADFKLTVCLCMAEKAMPEEQKIRWWGEPLKALLAEDGWDDIWLKTPDGRHIIYQWVGDGLSDKAFGIGDVLKNPGLVEADAKAYERLAEYCGIRAAYIYHMRWWMLKHADVIEELLDYYPAFWSFDPLNIRYAGAWDAFAKQCTEQQRAFTASICPWRMRWSWV
jgi:hypothetical protein